MQLMGRQQIGVRLARIFYGVVAIVALALAAATVATAVTGAGGCQLVLSLGPGSAAGPAGVGPSVPGLPSACQQYVDVVLPAVALVLGSILLLTTIRLGREPGSWGLSIAVGAIAGIVAALGAAYALVGIAASDQPQSSPVLGLLLIAAAPVLAALASALVVWRAHARGRAATAG
jgi:hypothetical protein